jgi:hypothetical protein
MFNIVTAKVLSDLFILIGVLGLSLLQGPDRPGVFYVEEGT